MFNHFINILEISDQTKSQYVTKFKIFVTNVIVFIQL